jgi:endoglucanase
MDTISENIKAGLSRRLNLVILLFLCWLCTAAFAQPKYPVSKYIVVDQFGYLPDSRKIAVIRDPQVGYDKNESFKPGEQYFLIDAKTGAEVLNKKIKVWLNGSTDLTSGDKAWWFDFSEITKEGSYYVLDKTNKVRSYEFNISKDVYKEVLKQAVRSFFYQRVGFKKEEKYTGKGWADKASHIGPLQDKNCRVYNDKDNPATERDVSGGWYDAGDYNKYTNWTANYVTDMMKSYLEYPEVWADDYNIPESGNGIPDLLDEAMWGVDHLLRIQNQDGSMISCIGESHASPPSAATGPSLYGTPSTSSALNSAAAFALASKVYGMIGKADYSEKLKQAAIKAWAWAEANPRVIFKNNDAGSGTQGLCAGQQEEDDYGRLMDRQEAAVFLFDVTGDVKYRDAFDKNYRKSHLFEWASVQPWEPSYQDAYLYYTMVKGATRTVADEIREIYKNGMGNDFASYEQTADCYMANLKDYTWGSNSVKSIVGNNFLNMIYYNVDPTKTKDAISAAEGYIHYIHGVNPLSMVYLSNMYPYGGENCVNEFYHSWFCDDSPLWNRVGESTYGPPPGFLTGGPNPSYDIDGCCPDNCGGDWAKNECSSEPITPPKGQPAQKAYKDFNTGWPLNSWSVTENSCGYQCNYIRLLSKLVPKPVK